MEQYMVYNSNAGIDPNVDSGPMSAVEAAAENARLRDALEKAEQQLDYGQIDAAHRIILAALKPENPNA